MFRRKYFYACTITLIISFSGIFTSVIAQYKNVTLENLAALPAGGRYYIKHARVGNLVQNFGVTVGGVAGNKLIMPTRVCKDLFCNQYVPKMSNGGITGVSFNNVNANQGYYMFSINNFTLNLGSFFGTPNYATQIMDAAEYDCTECIGAQWTYVDFLGYICLGDVQPSYKVYVGLHLLDDTKFPAKTFGDSNCEGSLPVITEGACCSGSVHLIGDILQFTTENGDHIERIADSGDGFFSLAQYQLNTEAHGPGPIRLRTNFVYTPSNIDNLGGGLIRSYPSNQTFIAAGNVIERPNVTAGGNQEFCDDTGDQNLTGAAPNGGSWSGTQFVSTEGAFNTDAAAPGDYVVTYSYTDPNTGCANTSNKTVTILPRPVVNAGNDLAACDDSDVVIVSGASPNGGSWSGSQFLNGNQFNTNAAPAGVHVLTYTYTNASGCSNNDTRNFNVLALPAVDAGVDLDRCVNAGAVPLNGQNPIGGQWSGPGVNGNMFNPAGPGVGLHNITYTYTDGNGCTNADIRQVTVLAAPIVSAGNDFDVCISANAFALSGGSPENGNWSGPGVNAGVFSPAQAGAGIHVITYQFTNESGCAAADTRTITVNSLPVVNAGPDMEYCINTPQFQINGGNPGGGAWSGSGVNVSLFNPALAGLGNHVLTYTYTNNNGCSNSDTRVFTVNPTTPVSIGFDKIFCSSGGVYNLNSDLAPQDIGGSWSGNGVSGNNFNPGNVPDGAYTITYTYSNQFGCVSSQSKEFSVIPGPAVDAGPVLETCINGGNVNLIGESPLGGTWSGLGVTNGNQFDPSENGVGVFNITYTYTTDVCTIADTRQVVVNNITPVDAGANLNKCDNNVDFLLTGASAQGRSVAEPLGRWRILFSC